MKRHETLHNEMNMWRPIFLSGVLGLLFLASGCLMSPKRVDFKQLYNRAAQYHGPERNPVIVIPGVLGSKLVEQPTRDVVWGAFTRGYANPNTSAGARLVALPMQRDVPLRELQDKGWTRPTQTGSFHWKAEAGGRKYRAATTWRITNQPIGLGTATKETKEYMKWKPEI